MSKHLAIANRRCHRKRDQVQARDRQLRFPFMLEFNNGHDEADRNGANVPRDFELEAREVEVPSVPV